MVRAPTDLLGLVTRKLVDVFRGNRGCSRSIDEHGQKIPEPLLASIDINSLSFR